MTPPSTAGISRPEVVTEAVPEKRAGWIRLATSADHKDVGRMYIATAFIFLAATLTLLLMMRIQLLIPDATLIRPTIFDRLLSNYAISGVLLFALPLFLGLMSYLVPLQIGARGNALPRINQLGFWMYLIGAITIYMSFLWRPSEAGSFAIPPLSDPINSPAHGVDAWAGGAAIVILGFVLFAVANLVTVRLHRAPGMVWRRMPLFSFASSVVSWLLVVIGPIMIAALTMLLIDRNMDGIFFNPDEGGAPLFYEHLAYIFFTGAYVAVVVSAIGAFSEILSTFSRQPVFSQRAIAGSMVAFTVLATLAWMQNMYAAPIRIGYLYFAMLMGIAAIVPIGLVVFNWIQTVSGGKIEKKAPLKYAIAGIVLMLFGFAGEWAQTVIPVNWQLANTGWAWGDTHFVMIGAAVLGGFAALTYWFPKITGRYMGEGLSSASCGLIFAGSLLMIFPLQLAGLEGMPADINEFFEGTGVSTYNFLASIGAFVTIIGVVVGMVNAASSYNNGAPAGHDAWGGTSLEWFALSPPDAHNFDLVPDVRSDTPLLDIRDAVTGNATELVLPAAKVTAPEPIAVGAAGESDPAPSEPEVSPAPVADESEAVADEAPEAPSADDEADGPVA